MSHGLYRNHTIALPVLYTSFALISFPKEFRRRSVVFIFLHKRHQKWRRQRKIWINEHFLLKLNQYFYRKFNNLMNNADKDLLKQLLTYLLSEVFFNDTRMRYINWFKLFSSWPLLIIQKIKLKTLISDEEKSHLKSHLWLLFTWRLMLVILIRFTHESRTAVRMPVSLIDQEVSLTGTVTFFTHYKWKRKSGLCKMNSCIKAALKVEAFLNLMPWRYLEPNNRWIAAIEE